MSALPEPLTETDILEILTPDYTLGDLVHSERHGLGAVSYASDDKGVVVYGVTYWLTGEYGCRAVLRERGVVPTGGRLELPCYPAQEPGGHGTSRGLGYDEHQVRRELAALRLGRAA